MEDNVTHSESRCLQAKRRGEVQTVFSYFSAAPPFPERRFHCRRFPDSTARCTGTDHNHPAYRTAAFCQSPPSENSDPRSWWWRNNLSPQPVSKDRRRSAWAHPYSGWWRYTGSNMPNAPPALQTDRTRRNTYPESHTLQQNRKNSFQTVRQCRRILRKWKTLRPRRQPQRRNPAKRFGAAQSARSSFS